MTTLDNNVANGLLNVTFDWGASGHPANSTDPFNFFGSVFRAKEDLHLFYLGDSSDVPVGANFYVSSGGIKCTIGTDDTTMQNCGDPTTSYFRVQPVPEPGTISMMGLSLIGFLVIGHLKRKKRKS